MGGAGVGTDLAALAGLRPEGGAVAGGLSFHAFAAGFAKSGGADPVASPVLALQASAIASVPLVTLVEKDGKSCVEVKWILALGRRGIGLGFGVPCAGEMW